MKKHECPSCGFENAPECVGCETCGHIFEQKKCQFCDGKFPREKLSMYHAVSYSDADHRHTRTHGDTYFESCLDCRLAQEAFEKAVREITMESDLSD